MEITSMSAGDIERAVPEIGRARAVAINEYCKQHGGVDSLDEFKNVPGVSDEIIEAMKKAGITPGK